MNKTAAWGVQVRDTTAANRLFLRQASLPVLGIHIQYSCARRLAWHKHLYVCGVKQFCASHFSFRRYRKIREYLLYSRIFL